MRCFDQMAASVTKYGAAAMSATQLQTRSQRDRVLARLGLTPNDVRALNVIRDLNYKLNVIRDLKLLTAN
jgi:hypothetical protein